MAKAKKNRASKNEYISPKQLTIVGFESPFSQFLDSNNRWVILANNLPWDILVGTYQSKMDNSQTGADGINPRVAIGSIILKHICNISDRETVLQIKENMYMQYFIGYSSFSKEDPFDPSLFVEFRKRMSYEQINHINEKIVERANYILLEQSKNKNNSNLPDEPKQEIASTETITHEGKLTTDATACPQDIAYPTDLNLLNDAREKSEGIIDLLYNPILHNNRPRTYKEIARKKYLQTAQKKTKSKREIHNAVKKQLGYLRRNLKSINTLLDQYAEIPLDKKQYKYLLVINTLYEQQHKMFTEGSHSIEHRIVSIHQPHVRPIVRGKTNANVEFGSKINVSLVNGFTFLDFLSWEAYNEGTYLMASIEKYKERFGFYPKEVLADKIYCNRNNRASLKLLGIKLRAKPLGRPTAADVERVRPGERNPIEGKFGQAKTTYGMNRIKARLQQTSESWIATIVLVLNLVKLTGLIAYCFIFKFFTFSARGFMETVKKLLLNFILLENYERKSC